jgi:arylsulfatase A-like enzyme
MIRKIAIGLLILLVLGFAGFAVKRYAFTVPLKTASEYNVVLISIDTTRADFIGCYGNRIIATPNIDRLAQQGVLFENYYSTVNTTLAAHASIFTGLYPRNHGVGRNSMRLNQKNLTLAEYLSAKDYKTAAFIGSYALASVFGINQGFATFDEAFIGDPSQYIAKDMQATNVEHKSFEWLVTKENVGHIMRSAEEVNRSFFQWLPQNKQHKFFAFVHYYDPHFPYDPPEQWYKRHLQQIPAGTPMTQDARGPLETLFQSQIRPVDGFRPEDMDTLELPDYARALLKLYLSEIEYTDHAVGQILDELKKEGLLSKTIVLVTADHGENLIDHSQFNSFFRHGFLPHESETHIPLIISCPGVLPAGHRIERTASEVDVFPTLLSFLGYKPPAVDGISLLADMFSYTGKSERPIFSESSQPHARFDKNIRNLEWINDLNSASVRVSDYKYINVPWKSYDGVFQIPEDPTEAKNLAGKEPDVMKELQSQLRDWRSKALTGNVDTSFELTDEEREKLQSLGYVQ